MAFSRGHALLIGVGSYAHASYLNVPQTAKDAAALAAVLQNERTCGYPAAQIQPLLQDEAASRERILAALDDLAKRTQPADTVLLFYAGHGQQGTDGNYYLTTHDTRMSGYDVKAGSGIAIADFLKRIQAIRAERLLFLCNACYSGRMPPDLTPDPAAAPFVSPPLPTDAGEALLSAGKGRIMITACGENQESQTGKGEITLFTQAVIEALQGYGVANHNGFISVFDLYEHVYDRVKEEAAALGKTQKPELTIIKGSGSFPVALYKGVTAPGRFQPETKSPEGAGVHSISEERSQRSLKIYIKNIASVQGDRNITIQNGSANHAVLVTGDHNQVNVSQVAPDDPARPDAQDLRRTYLERVYLESNTLSLAGVDPKAATDAETRLELATVYTALLTQTTAQLKQTEPRGERERRLSAVTMIDREKRLVLLGDPGSGKTTFVNFVTLCLAGELLGDKPANLALLTAPLPQSNEPATGQEAKQPERQPWRHGAPLPLRIILRDFAARGLHQSSTAPGAETLWQFVAAELTSKALGDFTPLLRKELLEKGGFVLFDGLDEAPEADSKRVQIKQVMDDFAKTYRKCRILVTSRTYAYQQQEWRLPDFADTVLEPFSKAQIEAFVDRWYAHVAVVRHLNLDDAQGRAALLKRAILANARLYALAERPLLLTLMASLHAWRGGTLPEKRVDLYADAVNLLLDSWESQRVVRNARGETELMQPSLAEVLKVGREGILAQLQQLAFVAHSGQREMVGTADIGEADLLSALLAINRNPDTRHLLLVEYLRDRAGLLTPRGIRVYTFPHRTFQEYLAACYLTGDDYPGRVAGLVREDPNRWREVTLLAGAKAAGGAAATLWMLVDALCYRRPSDPDFGVADLWGALLAGQALVETANLRNVAEYNRPKLERVRSGLLRALGADELPAVERATAGRLLAKLGDPRAELLEPLQMEFIKIPTGPFLMGEEKFNYTLPYAYWIARYPVSEAQYQVFVEAGGYGEQAYWPEAEAAGYWKKDGTFKADWESKPRRNRYDSGEPFTLPNHPVVGVTWYEALAFCRWLTQQLAAAGRLPAGYAAWLPSEPEWERSAAGREGRAFPYGDEADANRANFDATGIGSTSALGCFPGGASLDGVEELSGNVWEWTRSLYASYPYPSGGEELRKRENLGAGWSESRSLRGGAYYWDPVGCGGRNYHFPNYWFDFGGFRVVLSPSLLDSDPLSL